MSCIYCFFSKENQMELKKKCFGNPKYEETLKEYKELYLSELQKLDYVRNCNCIDDIENILNYDKEKIELYCNYLDDFLDDIKNNIDEISECFDSIISIYETYIKEDIYSAYNKMSDFFKKGKVRFAYEEAISYSKPMFRIREKGKYDKSNINEYFHIPFNKRFLSGNQRFSVSGQPMLYFASSLQTALIELGKKMDEVNVSIFLPSFSYNYDTPIYSIDNNAEDYIHGSIINLIGKAGSKLYYGEQYRVRIGIDLKQLSSSIFYNILTFPTDDNTKGTFIQEYVLPQLLTNILKSYDPIGIKYRSSKEHKWEVYDEGISSLEANICFFVPYSENSNYNEKFLSKFYYSCDTNNIISIYELNNKLKELEAINFLLRNEGYSNSDTGLHFVSIKMHIENMIKYKGNDYYESEEGKIERTLIYGLINNIINHVDYLKNNGLIRKINSDDYYNINVLNT